MSEMVQFVQDEDFHWYLLPYDLVKEFKRWEELMIKGIDCTDDEDLELASLEVYNFDSYRIDRGPEGYAFDKTTLKELY